MKRRDTRVTAAPPARLLVYAAADWLDLVDREAYDPDTLRNVSNGKSWGEPSRTRDQWAGEQAWALWFNARLDWHRKHGWSGGLSRVDLLRDSWEARRRAL